MNEGTPVLSIDGPVATLTLRRASQRNSLNDEDLHMRLSHVDAIEATPSVQVVVLRAETSGQPQPVFL